LIQIKEQALLFRAHCDDLVQFECFKWSRTSREATRKSRADVGSKCAQ
jgi:hypothetical protein